MRAVLAVFLGFVFVLSTIAANLSIWMLRAVLDTESFVATVGRTMDGAATRTAIGGYLAGSIVEVLNTRAPGVESAVAATFGLPPSASTDQLQEVLTPFVAGLLTDPRVKAVRDRTLEQVHGTLTGSSQAPGGVVGLQGSQLVLDLRPLIIEVGAILPGGALTESSIPADIGLITLADWPGFSTIASTVQLLSTLQVVIPLVLVAMALLIFLDARRRLRAIAFIGLGLALGGLAGIALDASGGSIVATGVTQPELQAAVRESFAGVTTQLAEQSLLLLAIGSLLAVLFFTLDASRNQRGRTPRLARS